MRKSKYAAQRSIRGITSTTSSKFCIDHPHHIKHTHHQPTNQKTSHPRKKQDESTRLLSVTTNIYYFFNYFSYQPTATSIIGCLTHPQNSTSDHRESHPRLIDSSECANNVNTHPPRFVCGASELLQNIHSSFTQKPPQQSRVRFRFSGTICY